MGKRGHGFLAYKKSVPVDSGGWCEHLLEQAHWCMSVRTCYTTLISNCPNLRSSKIEDVLLLLICILRGTYKTSINVGYVIRKSANHQPNTWYLICRSAGPGTHYWKTALSGAMLGNTTTNNNNPLPLASHLLLFSSCFLKHTYSVQ